MKPVRFHRHALERLAERGIGTMDVEHVILTQPIQLPIQDGVHGVIGYIGARGLIVRYKETVSEIWVLTAYWVR